MHGLQNFPESIPAAKLKASFAYRSRKHRVAALSELDPSKALETARVVASSFALREPMGRHLAPPKTPPEEVMKAAHRDPFGSDIFGPWTAENIIYWLIRLFILTDPSSPAHDIRHNEDVLRQSLAVLGPNDEVLGGAFNQTMPSVGEAPPFRNDDPFIEAVLACYGCVFEHLNGQEDAALGALSNIYPAFRDALYEGLVGHHFLVARGDGLATEHAFELVASTVERYQRLGFRYVGTEATNQWTGAAFEVLGGFPVHFFAYQEGPSVRKSQTPLPDRVTSPNGFLSNKDSGCMFYLLGLNN